MHAILFHPGPTKSESVHWAGNFGPVMLSHKEFNVVSARARMVSALRAINAIWNPQTCRLDIPKFKHKYVACISPGAHYGGNCLTAIMVLYGIVRLIHLSSSRSESFP